MTPSARAAALRSTALATSLALAVGLSALAADAWAKPKVPLPKPRPIARNVVPKTSARNTLRRPAPPPGIPRPPRPPLPAAHRPGARDAPACGAAAATARKPAVAGRGGRDVIDLAGRYRCAGKRHRAGAQAQAGGCDPGRGGDIGSGRKKARGMDHPAQRRQRRVGRALSRLHLGQSELAVADLPAPAPRGGAVGRPSRRRHRVGMVRKRIAAVGQGQVLAGAGDARARRPRQCRAPGARGLAQRSDVGGHRERRARSVRRAADAGRSQGADGSSALRQRARGRAARRQAARRRSGRAGEGAHRGLPARPPTPGRCSTRFRTNCMAIPATSSARSSCCAAKRNSPRPPS